REPKVLTFLYQRETKVLTSGHSSTRENQKSLHLVIPLPEGTKSLYIWSFLYQREPKGLTSGHVLYQREPKS
ncbi:hypothetical protein Bpfe_025575, partial [Biomphalaria pfeifferi]